MWRLAIFGAWAGSADPSAALSEAVQAVAATARPSVVYLRVEKSRRLAPELQELLLDAGLPAAPWDDRDVVREASGAGVIIDATGRVLTNHHVVEGAVDVWADLTDGRHVPAYVIDSDPRTDLAVLQLQGVAPVPALQLAEQQPKVGEIVVAIGSPFDFSSSVSLGIVSALGRRGLSARDVEDFIQTDAAVNPGNSGGPLLDLQGRVIGINTAIYAPEADQSAGISFAVPSTLALRVLDDLADRRVPQRAWIGVVPGEPSLVEGDLSRRGVSVARVWPRSPAEAAGLRRGDLITGVEGVPVHDAATLRAAIAAQPVGAVVDVSVARGDQRLTPSITPVDAARAGTGDADVADVAVQWGGLTLVAPTAAWRAAYGVSAERGALVVSVASGSGGARMGLAAGDRIVEVGGRPIDDLASLADVARPGGGPLVARVERAGHAFWAVLPPR